MRSLLSLCQRHQRCSHIPQMEIHRHSLVRRNIYERWLSHLGWSLKYGLSSLLLCIFRLFFLLRWSGGLGLLSRLYHRQQGRIHRHRFVLRLRIHIHQHHRFQRQQLCCLLIYQVLLFQVIVLFLKTDLTFLSPFI